MCTLTKGFMAKDFHALHVRLIPPAFSDPVTFFWCVGIAVSVTNLLERMLYQKPWRQLKLKLLFNQLFFFRVIFFCPIVLWLTGG